MARKHGIDIDSGYIADSLKAPHTAVSVELGHSRGWLDMALKRKQMAQSDLKCLCIMYGLEYDKAVQKEEPQEEPKEEAAGDALMLHTEMVVSYMQDLGKIQTDTLRELRELRHEQKELITKLTAELHELNVYIKNDAPASKGQRTAINNNLSMILNYIQKKGEQQCQK